MRRRRSRTRRGGDGAGAQDAHPFEARLVENALWVLEQELASATSLIAQIAAPSVTDYDHAETEQEVRELVGLQ